MRYREEVRDLFSVPSDYYLVHCISADFRMGAGIAVEFDKRFNMKALLESKYSDYLYWHRTFGKGRGDCLLEGRILNLVTKERYFYKPTYKSVRESLEVLRGICEKHSITKIAMPLIGCGLDKLQWEKVFNIIAQVFSDTSIEILVCKR